MAEKQMTIADLNVVFGKEEEPLLKRMDDIVLPALQSGIIRPASENTRFLFEDYSGSVVKTKIQAFYNEPISVAELGRCPR